ncbi:hypothetical protein BJ508DRAFT_414834 [Ascobolus immersus RN42]|uniref:Uncharacterized protein n=1 Tax=Ascobolus immersus RN42 TaxID=1160509 RepID=A0A3N4IB88_ASCIM|nr:hypothetical protein BJ508DRAFT_414834 [Ascobolus immersus RN42]
MESKELVPTGMGASESSAFSEVVDLVTPGSQDERATGFLKEDKEDAAVRKNDQNWTDAYLRADREAKERGRKAFEQFESEWDGLDKDLERTESERALKRKDLKRRLREAMKRQMDEEDKAIRDQRRRTQQVTLSRLPSPPDEFLWSIYLSYPKEHRDLETALDRCLLELYKPPPSFTSEKNIFYYEMVYEPFQKSLRFFTENVARHLGGHVIGNKTITDVQEKAWKSYAQCFYAYGFLFLKNRLDAGLLRKGQVRLILAAHKSTVDFFAEILATSENKSQDIVTACYMLRSLLGNLLCSEKFRSERLELLLLKYLAEEEVNMDVAKAVVRQTERKSEGREPSLYRLIGRRKNL